MVGVTTISIDSKVRSREGVYDSLNGLGDRPLRKEGKDATEFQVGKEVQYLGSEVKDKAFQGVVILIVGRGFLCVHPEEKNGIFDGRGVSDDGM